MAPQPDASLRIPHFAQVCNVGWEQEFFLVDRESFLERPDLVACGRALLGALPQRGQVGPCLALRWRSGSLRSALLCYSHVAQQQFDTNYFARMPLRVRACLREAQAEIWQLGNGAVIIAVR